MWVIASAQVTEPIIYRKLLRDLGQRSNQWPVKCNIMPGTSQWSVVLWNSARHFCELHHKGQGAGFSSQARRYWWHSINSYYLVKINYQNVYLLSLSDSTIFTVHHLLWILNVRVIKVVSSSYNTASKKRKMLPRELLQEKMKVVKSQLRLYIFILEFYFSSPVYFPGIYGSHRISTASPD